MIDFGFEIGGEIFKTDFHRKFWYGCFNFWKSVTVNRVIEYIIWQFSVTVIQVL